MTHLTEEETIEFYYGAITRQMQVHLDGCEECRANLNRVQDLLRSVEQYPVPEPPPGYEAKLWTRLAPQLPGKKKWNVFSFLQPAILVPVLALALLLTVVLTRVPTSRGKAAGIPKQAQTRMLFSAVSDHLDRTEILLSELVNASPGSTAMKDSQAYARDLADENRLLRVTSAGSGDESHQALLDDLERVLLTVANAPPDVSPADLAALLQRINDQDLLFKVRIADSHLRGRERTL